MNAIVSVTYNWGIGKDGELVVKNRDDMRFFCDMTTGGTVIMGYATYKSLGGKPLKDRQNVVITSKNVELDGFIVVHSVEEAVSCVEGEDTTNVWVIGGSSIYEQMLPLCEYAYVTFNQNTDVCDRFFPNLEDDDTWVRDRTCHFGVNDDGYMYVIYLYRNTELKPYPAFEDYRAFGVKDSISYLR